MSAGAGSTPVIPPELVKRFADAFDTFVKAAEDAVAEAGQKPELRDTQVFAAWRAKALPLLEEENAGLKSALAQYQAGDARAVLAQAVDKRGLAKDMDGYPLTFAGAEHAQKLGELRTAVVRSASQLCAAAGIP